MSGRPAGTRGFATPVPSRDTRVLDVMSRMELVVRRSLAVERRLLCGRHRLVRIRRVVHVAEPEVRPACRSVRHARQVIDQTWRRFPPDPLLTSPASSTTTPVCPFTESTAPPPPEHLGPSSPARRRSRRRRTRPSTHRLGNSTVNAAISSTPNGTGQRSAETGSGPPTIVRATSMSSGGMISISSRRPAPPRLVSSRSADLVVAGPPATDDRARHLQRHDLGRARRPLPHAPERSRRRTQ